MGTSEIVPIFARIVREGGLPVPLHRSPLQDQLGLQGFVYGLRHPEFFLRVPLFFKEGENNVRRKGTSLPGCLRTES